MRTLRLLAPCLPLLLTLACAEASGPREYQNNDLVLVTSYAAKEMCSCVFVMGHTEDSCRRWTRQAPAVAVSRVDRDARRVEASALMTWSARARFVDERTGCVLE